MKKVFRHYLLTFILILLLLSPLLLQAVHLVQIESSYHAADVSFKDTAYNDCSFSRGDTLECDFVSWSHDYFRHRMVTLVVNGRS